MAETNYQVFLSYRREGGDAIALFLRERLLQRGLHVFLDVVDLRRGYFDEALLRHIERTPNFVVILSPGSMDRCVNEDDWLRREIAHAIKTDRNIIPVLLKGFAFPGHLPDDLKDLPRHQGVEYSHFYHQAMIDSILENLVGENETPSVTPVPPAPPSPMPSVPQQGRIAPLMSPISSEFVAPEQVSTPATRLETQNRVLDAAMAARVPVGKPAELAAMIRREGSPGLKGELQLEESDAKPEDVRSRPFQLDFPVDAMGKVGEAEVVLRVNAPDFEPPLQSKKLHVPPNRDSLMYSFLLTPKFEGDLRISLELCLGDVCVASRVLRTNGEPSDRSASREKVLVSLPLQVQGVTESGAGMPAAASAPASPAAAPQPAASQSGGANAMPSIPASPPPPPRPQAQVPAKIEKSNLSKSMPASPLPPQRPPAATATAGPPETRRPAPAVSETGVPQQDYRVGSSRQTHSGGSHGAEPEVRIGSAGQWSAVPTMESAAPARPAAGVAGKWAGLGRKLAETLGVLKGSMDARRMIAFVVAWTAGRTILFAASNSYYTSHYGRHLFALGPAYAFAEAIYALVTLRFLPRLRFALPILLVAAFLTVALVATNSDGPEIAADHIFIPAITEYVAALAGIALLTDKIKGLFLRLLAGTAAGMAAGFFLFVVFGFEQAEGVGARLVSLAFAAGTFALVFVLMTKADGESVWSAKG